MIGGLITVKNLVRINSALSKTCKFKCHFVFKVPNPGLLEAFGT